jgi:hypothetical protein
LVSRNIIIILLVVFGTYYFDNSDQFQTVSVYLIMVFVLGSIIGWSSIFSVIKRPASFKQVVANYYIIFLVSVLNHAIIPDRFILITVALGSFLGRRLMLVLPPISYLKSILIILICIYGTFFLSFSFIFGYFLLCTKYPKTFGTFLITFFEKNASPEILTLIGLEKKETLKKRSSRAKNKKSKH